MSEKAKREKKPHGPVDLYVHDVTIYLCRACLRVTDKAGVDLRSLVSRSVDHVAGMIPLAPATATVDVRLGRFKVGPNDTAIGFAHSDEAFVSVPKRGPWLEHLDEWLPSVIAHELHHTSRETKGPGVPWSFLDLVVSEGLAASFEREAFPRLPAVDWDALLTPGEEEHAWRELQPRLNTKLTEQGHLRFFLGEADLPDATGYVIGFHIVQGYLARHPGSSVAKLATVESKTILRGSGYSP